MSGPIICVGHAALDRVYRVAALPTGAGKIRAIEHIESGGGMAANAAVGDLAAGRWRRKLDTTPPPRSPSSVATSSFGVVSGMTTVAGLFATV